MNVLCKLGLHKTDPYRYIVVRKCNGRHKWHTNYAVCVRCGKRVQTLAKVRVTKHEDSNCGEPHK